jgi:predicted acetyltransferase
MDKAGEELGVDHVLITCDTANTASYRIIEKNGGVRAGESISDYTGNPVTRFWVPI